MGDVLLWYLWTQAFAFGGWLIAARWLGALPDQGYGIGKMLGLTLGGFAYWAGVTLGFSANHAGAALLALVVVWSVGLWLRYTTGDAECAPHGAHRPWRASFVVAEALFVLAFVGWAIVRAHSPEIMSAGGEKFMESMMINAILRSPTFPPNDAWMSGYSLSYYYFGYILFAMLILLSGVAPAVGFNLGGAMIFALTVVGAFSVGYNLWGLKLRSEDARLQARPPRFPVVNSQLAAGLLTALMLALMGNLGGLMGALKCSNALPQSFWQWLDVRDTAAQVYACDGLAPSEFYGWWWDWSRVVKDTTPGGQYQETITEVPIFSFVLGDNHPHVMALPLAMLVLTLALDAFRNGALGAGHAARSLPVSQRASRIAQAILLPAIVLGSLAFTNTWDFPVYGAIFIVAGPLGEWLQRRALLRALLRSAGVVALGYLLYLPWHVTFASQARGIAVNLFNGTRFAHFFVIYAPFLIAGAGLLWLATSNARAPVRAVLGRAAGLTALVIGASLLAAIVVGLASPQGRAMAQELATTGATMGLTNEQVSRRLVERATTPWTVLALAGSVALCAVLITSWRRACAGNGDGDAAASPPHTDAFALLLMGAGALLTLGVEFVFLRDLFGTRMNTVFKLYYQAWTLWSVAGAYAIVRLLSARGIAARVFGFVATAFVGLGLLYPAMAIPARTNNFSGPPMLDGAAYLQTSHPEDAKMIAWLNANVSGAPYLVEAPPAGPFGAYAYEGRIATFTGLPTALGWGGHQHQWRGTTDEQARRFPLIEQLYNTTDLLEARRLLREFKAEFVIVGAVERSRFTPEGLSKFESLCATAFQAGRSVIYRCRP